MSLKLSEFEQRDPLWMKLKAYMEERITRLRKDNDADLTHEATCRLRGRIKSFQELISVGSQTPDIGE